jgi:hypothetical protein
MPRHAPWTLCLLSLVAPLVAPLAALGAPPLDLEVHEWGLVRFGDAHACVASSGRTSMANVFGQGQGLGPAHQGARGGKPVLYFHPGPKFDARTELTVTASLKGGALREVWPTPALGAQPKLGESFTWKLKVLAGRNANTSAAPKVTDAACQGLDAPCESAELPLYLPTVSDGLLVTGVHQPVPVLLYNGTLPLTESPLRPDGAGAVRNSSDVAFGVTWVRLPDGNFKALEAAPKGVTKYDASKGQPLTVDGLRVQVRAALVAQGLSGDEADAFVKAWSPDVLSPASTWSVLTFYPQQVIDALAPLRITPAPAKVVRVMALVSP